MSMGVVPLGKIVGNSVAIARLAGPMVGAGAAGGRAGFVLGLMGARHASTSAKVAG